MRSLTLSQSQAKGRKEEERSMHESLGSRRQVTGYKDEEARSQAADSRSVAAGKKVGPGLRGERHTSLELDAVGRTLEIASVVPRRGPTRGARYVNHQGWRRASLRKSTIQAKTREERLKKEAKGVAHSSHHISSSTALDPITFRRLSKRVCQAARSGTDEEESGGEDERTNGSALEARKKKRRDRARG